MPEVNGGQIETGSYLAAPMQTPMTNLFLSPMDKVGVQEERIVDSTGDLVALGVWLANRFL